MPEERPPVPPAPEPQAVPPAPEPQAVPPAPEPPTAEERPTTTAPRARRVPGGTGTRTPRRPRTAHEDPVATNGRLAVAEREATREDTAARALAETMRRGGGGTNGARQKRWSPTHTVVLVLGLAIAIAFAVGVRGCGSGANTAEITSLKEKIAAAENSAKTAENEAKKARDEVAARAAAAGAPAPPRPTKSDTVDTRTEEVRRAVSEAIKGIPVATNLNYNLNYNGVSLPPPGPTATPQAPRTGLTSNEKRLLERLRMNLKIAKDRQDFQENALKVCWSEANNAPLEAIRLQAEKDAKIHERALSELEDYIEKTSTQIDALLAKDGQPVPPPELQALSPATPTSRPTSRPSPSS